MTGHELIKTRSNKNISNNELNHQIFCHFLLYESVGDDNVRNDIDIGQQAEEDADTTKVTKKQM